MDEGGDQRSDQSNIQAEQNIQQSIKEGEANLSRFVIYIFSKLPATLNAPRWIEGVGVTKAAVTAFLKEAKSENDHVSAFYTI